MSAYVWSEKESRKTTALRKKDERSSQAKDSDLFEVSLSKGVEPPPFAPVFTQTERRLDVLEGCAGILIGKKGENIRNVEQRFRVTIRIEDVNADGRSPSHPVLRRQRGGPQQVVISGLTPDAVRAAARELDIVAETMDVPAEMASWFVGRGGKHLKFIKELSALPVLSLRRSGGEAEGAPAEGEGDVAAAIREVLGADAEEEDAGGRKKRRGKPGRRGHADGSDEEDAGAAEAEFGDHAQGQAEGAGGEGRAVAGEEHCWLELKGRRDRVADARLLFETHMGYYPVYLEMREAETALDREISEAQALLGRSGGRGRGRSTGDRGDGAGADGATLGSGTSGAAGRGRGRGGKGAEGSTPPGGGPSGGKALGRGKTSSKGRGRV